MICLLQGEIVTREWWWSRAAQITVAREAEHMGEPQTKGPGTRYRSQAHILRTCFLQMRFYYLIVCSARSSSVDEGSARRSHSPLQESLILLRLTVTINKHREEL